MRIYTARLRYKTSNALPKWGNPKSHEEFWVPEVYFIRSILRKKIRGMFLNASTNGRMSPENSF